MPIEDYPSRDLLRQMFRYENGHLFWLERPVEHFSSAGHWIRWNIKFAGEEAGGLGGSGGNHPQWTIKVGSKRQLRYRIVWAMHMGEWPPRLDHKNRDSLDDRIENLRPATQSQNIANSRLNAKNTSGYKGVSFDKRRGKWFAQIKVNYKTKFLGYFDDRESAHAARLEASTKYFGEFACAG